MTAHLVDTSVFVAIEQRTSLGEIPDGESRVSVATLTELLVGVELVRDEKRRAVREATLAKARSYIPVAFDEVVAGQLAKVLAAAKCEGRRADAMDAIIASTAIVHDLTVWTLDDDFRVLAELAPELRVVGI